MAGPWEKFQPQVAEPSAKPWEKFASADQETSMLDDIKQGLGNLLAGGVRGAGSIGSTLLTADDLLGKFKPMALAANIGNLTSKGRDLSSQITGKSQEGYLSKAWNDAMKADSERRAGMDSGLEYAGAQPDSLVFKGGKLAGEIAGTAGAGGALANTARFVAPTMTATPRAAQFLNAISSGGMTTGAPAAAGMRAAIGNLGTRAAGGAISGGVSAGLVNPEDAALGAAIGGALPGVTKVAGMVGRKVGSALRGKPLADEVRALATRAQELGIDIPVDRLANSKPLNAVASSLNYMPFSGRAGTEAKMQSQLNRALSRTFGQDSDNVTQALRKANSDLGGEFDRVLRSNTVKIDSQFLDELAEAEQTAARELGADGAGVISRQIDEIMNKGSSGQIDGQTAYNIKKMLDRIGKRSTPEAYYAGDLRRSLMGALDRSMTPDAAKAFATTRKQYGNMLTLEKLAQNGAEGDVSIARIANMKNIGNADLQELADISAQFLKPREGAHGSMQRAVAALGVGGTLGLPALAGGAVAGRGVNSVMNSRTAREMMLNGGVRGLSPEMLEVLYRTAPVVANQ